ncbi:hypothetical protein AB6D70_22820 [Vibrio splendidus]
MKKVQSQVNVEKNSSQLAKIKKVRMGNKKPDEQTYTHARCN